MPSTLKPPRAIQLPLFRPSRNEPRWEAIPIEIQPQVLRLLARLIDAHSDRQRLPAATEARAAHRGGPEVVQTNRDPDMGIGSANAIRRVEADPTQVLDIGFSPGVPGLLGGHAVGAVKVASDIPRRDAEGARSRDKDVSDVLADSASKRKSLRSGGCSVRRIGIENDFTI